MKRLSFAMMLALSTLGVWAQWNEATGKKTTRTLKWNGHGFGK